MKNLILYRVLTYLLFAVAGLMSFTLLATIMAALANPALLFLVFIIACVIIYTYCSWRFLKRGIDAHLYCKPSLRDLIKVNGYGSIAFSILFGFASFTVLTNPQLMEAALENAISMQQAAVEGMEDSMRRSMNIVLKFLLVYSVLLLTHIIITFRLLRTHADAFHAH
ncbi:hypothetical protein [Flavihumibacter solisilvae]|uniref:DUF4199 domain-containing protein n=1 Tax=Flavihumibacter solisilvae TaxID=1349421 RepID=A0A0C1IJV9_9BACT|nr:hypothetical protein [Flavihumibacter solisilvae]KIC90729.1 hypothetical protein OI18_22805 [Flavihumibacter solisilvae]